MPKETLRTEIHTDFLMTQHFAQRVQQGGLQQQSPLFATQLSIVNRMYPQLCP